MEMAPAQKDKAMLLPSPIDCQERGKSLHLHLLHRPRGLWDWIARGFDYGVQALPISRMRQLEDMAEAILFLASDASNYINGQVWNVDGGWIMA